MLQGGDSDSRERPWGHTMGAGLEVWKDGGVVVVLVAVVVKVGRRARLPSEHTVGLTTGG